MVTIEEFIEQLKELNTGANTQLVLRLGDQTFTDPQLGFAQINPKEGPPYAYDNDYPMVMVIDGE